MLFVQPSTQCKGIGTALLRRVLAVARAQEFREFKCRSDRQPTGSAVLPQPWKILTGRRVPGAAQQESDDER